MLSEYKCIKITQSAYLEQLEYNFNISLRTGEFHTQIKFVKWWRHTKKLTPMSCQTIDQLRVLRNFRKQKLEESRSDFQGRCKYNQAADREYQPNYET